jgi:hypothetical protein
MFWRNILLAILLYAASSPVFAQSTQSQPAPVEESFFEGMFPPLSDDDAKTYRDGFLLGCDPKADEKADFDCNSADVIIASKLIAETARMNGFLRACGQEVWRQHFGYAVRRVQPLFKESGVTVGLHAGYMHGGIQGITRRLVEDNNLCTYVPSEVDPTEFLEGAAAVFFSTRLLTIQSKLSFPIVYNPEERALIDRLDRERNGGNSGKPSQPR